MKINKSIETLLAKVPVTLQEHVQQAVVVAKAQHKGQVRQGGKPYITHVLAVAEKAAHYVEHNDVSVSEARILIIGALLHDVIEDTDMTFEQVGELFGADIAYTVQALSHDDEDEPSKVYLAKVVAGGHLAILIKRFDKTHNLESLSEAPEEFRVKKLAELRDDVELWKSFDPEGAHLFEEQFL